ncbi:MAG TPA: ATP-binding protein [Polyangiaceae bacterium]|nr:ATP-binding protein [Polyangiaceae bacterium]
MALGETVRAEQIRMLFGQNRAVLWANVAVSALVAGPLWILTSTPRPLLAAWVALTIAVAAGRVALGRRFDTTRPQPKELEVWGQRFVAGSIAAGALWGVATLVFFDATHAMTEALFSFAIGGMTAAAAGTWSSHLPTFRGYCLASLGPFIVRTFAVGDWPHTAMGLMLLAYGIFIDRVARTNHASISKAFHLAFENADLLERLSRSQEVLENANRVLEQRVRERTAEIEKQEAALRDAQRMESLGRLAGGIAHDFNNLLTIGMTNVDVLKDTQHLDAVGNAALLETLDSMRRGAELVQRLLAFSSRLHLESKPVDLNEVIVDIRPLLVRLAGARVNVTFDLSPRPLRVLADVSRLRHVLINLVSNAGEAMANGGELRIVTQRTDALLGEPAELRPCALLRVDDTGIGMDEDTLRHAFDPFFSTKVGSPDHGLGLAAVHGIIQQSGGRVNAESKLGHGSRFFVHLPINEAVEHSPAPLIKGTASESARVATILIAEDEPMVRSTMRRNLARLGHRILEAEDGARALALARSHGNRIDLLITDVVMPNLGGAELVKTLAPEQRGMAVLFISGYSWGEELPPSDERKGVAYLAKPFDTKSLDAKVTELLSIAGRLAAS